jgi:hypothetical protein
MSDLALTLYAASAALMFLILAGLVGAMLYGAIMDWIAGH